MFQYFSLYYYHNYEQKLPMRWNQEWKFPPRTTAAWSYRANSVLKHKWNLFSFYVKLFISTIKTETNSLHRNPKFLRHFGDQNLFYWLNASLSVFDRLFRFLCITVKFRHWRGPSLPHHQSVRTWAPRIYLTPLPLPSTTPTLTLLTLSLWYAASLNL